MFKGLAKTLKKTFSMSGGRRKTRKGRGKKTRTRRGKKTRGGRRRVDVKSMTRKFSKPAVHQKPKLASWKTGPRVSSKLAERGRIFGLEKKAPPTAPKPRPRPAPRAAPRPAPRAGPRPRTKHQGCPDGVTMTTKEFDEDKHRNAINLYKKQTGFTGNPLSKVIKRGPGGRPMGYINEATPGFRTYIKEECPILITPTSNDPCYFDYPTKEKCQAVGADGADGTAKNCKCSWLVDSTLPSNKRCKKRKTPGTCI